MAMQKFPSSFRMFLNLMSAIKRSLVRFFKGKELTVSKEMQENRLMICKGCEFLSVDGTRCYECGCFIKAKTKLISEECPIEKW
jgi:hypothetical protein